MNEAPRQKKGARGLSLKTCRNIIDSSFRALVRDARRIDGLLDRDPFESVTWPRRDTPPPDPLTDDERDRILGHFAKKEPFYYPFIFSLFWTGMRPS